jgi:hypothetical protein
MKRPNCLSRRFDLEHGDKAREPLRQQIDPAPTRKAPPLRIMHRYAAIEQARCELQSEQDRDGRKSTFSPTAKHLSHDTWRDTLAILRDTFVQRGGRGIRSPTSPYRALHFRSAEFFMMLSDPRQEPLSMRVTCPVAFAYDVLKRSSCATCATVETNKHADCR